MKKNVKDKKVGTNVSDFFNPQQTCLIMEHACKIMSEKKVKNKRSKMQNGKTIKYEKLHHQASKGSRHDTQKESPKYTY